MASLAAAGGESKATTDLQAGLTVNNKDGEPTILTGGPADSQADLYSPTDEEQAAIQVFDQQNPAYSNLPVGFKIRFLRARDLDQQKTVSMLKDHIAWSTDIKPYSVKQEDIRVSLESGCWRYLGKTENGLPILWVQVGLWNPHEYTIEEYQNMVAFFVTNTLRTMTDGTQIIALFDMAGWAFWHGRYLRYIKRLADTFQNNFPETLSKILLLNAPMLFRGVWAVIRGFLDPKTAQKVVFLNGDEAVQAQLLDIAAPHSIIPDCYGGGAAAGSIPVPNFPGQPNVGDVPSNDADSDVCL